jgi:hypothetical protein
MNLDIIDLDEDIADEGSIYSDAAREFLLDQDELTSEEDGFMAGWDMAYESGR